MTGTVNMSAEGAQILGKSFSSIGHNIGLAGTVGAMGGAIASVLSKSGLPAPVKTGAVIFAGAAGAGIHTGTIAMQKMVLEGKDKNTDNINKASNSYGGSDTPPSPSSFGVNSPNEELVLLDPNNPVGVVLSSILTLNVISLFLVICLAIIFLFKLFLPINLELKWLNYIVTPYYRPKIKDIIIKLISLIKKNIVVNIILLMFILIISSTGSVYLLIYFISNFESVVTAYLKYTGK